MGLREKVLEGNCPIPSSDLKKFISTHGLGSNGRLCAMFYIHIHNTRSIMEANSLLCKCRTKFLMKTIYCCPETPEWLSLFVSGVAAEDTGGTDLLAGYGISLARNEGLSDNSAEHNEYYYSKLKSKSSFGDIFLFYKFLHPTTIIDHRATQIYNMNIFK